MIDFLSRHDWLGHIVEALVMAVIGALVAMLTGIDWRHGVVIGCVGAAQHFYGREKRDCEVRTKMKAPHLKAYWPGYWNKDELTDFFPVVGVMVVIIVFVRWVI